MYVCVCKAVSDQHIKCAVECGRCGSLEDLVVQLAIGTQCGRCLECAQEHLEKVLSDKQKCSSSLPAVAA